MKQETLNPRRIIALGATIIFLFCGMLFMPSCNPVEEEDTYKGITQETLLVVEPMR